MSAGRRLDYLVSNADVAGNSAQFIATEYTQTNMIVILIPKHMAGTFWPRLTQSLIHTRLDLSNFAMVETQPGMAIYIYMYCVSIICV